MFSEWNGLFSVRHSIVDCRGGAGHQALAGAIRYGFGQCFGRETEHQYRCPAAPIGSVFSINIRFNSRFGIAGNHRRAIAGKLTKCRIQPVGIKSGDQEPDIPHAKSFCKGVNDLGAA